MIKLQNILKYYRTKDYYKYLFRHNCFELLAYRTDVWKSRHSYIMFMMHIYLYPLRSGHRKTFNSSCRLY